MEAVKQLIATISVIAARRWRALLLLCAPLVWVAPCNGQITFIGAQSTVPATGLNLPYGATSDPFGNVYIADARNNRVVKIDVLGNQTVLSTVPLTLSAPEAIVSDAAGNLFISDFGNNRVVKVPAGGGAATALASVFTPGGLGVDATGNVFVTDIADGLILKITSVGVTSTFKGGLPDPLGVAVDVAGNVYLADGTRSSVMKYPAGGGPCTNVGSSLFGLAAVAVDRAGNVYAVEDGEGVNIVEIPPTGSQFYLATSGLVSAAYLTVDANYNLLIPDSGNNDVIEFATKSVNMGFANVCVSGAPAPCSQTATLNFTVSEDSIGDYWAVANALQGQDFDVVDGNCGGETSPCTVVVTFAPQAPGTRSGAVVMTEDDIEDVSFPIYGTGLGANSAFFPPSASPPYNFDSFENPSSLAVAGPGLLDEAELFVSDAGACDVFIIGDGTYTYAGNGACGYSGDGGPANAASINGPSDISIDGAGNMYIADTRNNLIRKVDVNQIISTFAGNAGSGAGFSGDGGPATSAQLHNPNGVAVDLEGNVYIADSANGRIRKVDLSGTITTVAGNGTAGYSGDGGAATSAELNYPLSMRVDTAGDIFIADSNNAIIRKVDVTGKISTVAGNFELGPGGGGDGGPATSAQLQYPNFVTVSAAGELFICDEGTSSVRRVDGGGKISTYPTPVELPINLLVDPMGNMVVLDPGEEALAVIGREFAAGVAFNNQNVNTTSGPQDVGVTNMGNEPLDFAAITPGPGFNVNGPDTSCSTESALGIGLDCILGIEFDPPAAEQFSAGILLTDNAPGTAGASQQTIPASGTGVSPVTSTTTTVAGSPNPGSAGQTITFTATVVPAPTGPPLGTVSFYNGETLLGTGNVNSSGVAILAVTSLTTAQTYMITAVYSGNSTFGGSNSTCLSEEIGTAFGVTAPQTPFNVAQGGSVGITVTVPPIGGAYNGLVTMSATGLPTGATITFNPPTVTPGAAGITTLMTIQLPRVISALPHATPNPPNGRLPLALTGVALALCGMLGAWRRARMARLAFATVAVIGASLVCASCNGGLAGAPSTPSGQYTVTVTGTSGSLHASTTVSVVVQ